ncbi:hypothetical protein [Anaerolentibacter hominis]|uniref:ATP-binding protein n=1 Tax=Anaerolentibacter hominis TaxID=3079009 RepID=UPI0031B83AC5
MLASKGIEFLSEQLYNYIHRNEIAIAKADELNNAFHEQYQSTTSNLQTVQSLSEEYALLSQQVDANGNSLTLSADELQRYHDITNQICDMFPSLRKGFDEEGNAIADKNTLIQESINLLKEQQKLQLLDQTSNESNRTVIKGVLAKQEEAKKEAGSYATKTASAFYDAVVEKEYGGEIPFPSIEEIAEFAKRFDLSTENLQGDMYTLGSAGAFRELIESEENALKITEQLSDTTSDAYQMINGTAAMDDATRSLYQYTAAMRSSERSASEFNQQALINVQATEAWEQMGDSQKTFLTNYIDSIKLQGGETQSEMQKILDSVVDFSNLTMTSTDFQDYFRLQENMDQIPVEELREQLHTIIEKILSDPALSDEQKITLQVALGDSLSDTDENLASIRTKLSKKGFFYDDIMEWTRGMDADDIEIAYSIITDPHSSFSGFDELRNEFNKTKKILDDPLHIDMDQLNEVTQEVSRNLDIARNSSDDIGAVTDAVNQKFALNASQIDELSKRYPGLESMTIATANGFYLEKGAINLVNGAVTNLKTAYAAAQAAMSKILTNEVLQRLKNMRIELSGIKTLAQAHDVIAQQEADFVDENGINPGHIDPTDSFIGKDTKSTILLAGLLGEYETELDNQIKSIDTGKVPGGGSGSSFSAEINWIDIKLKRLQETAKETKQALEDAFTIQGQKTAFSSYLSALNDQIKSYEDIVSKYDKELKKIGLDKKTIKKIEEGSIDITKYSSGDKKQYEKIQKYMDLYDKQKSALEQLAELEKSIQAAYKEYFDGIQELYSRKSDLNSAKQDRIQAEIDLAESKGMLVSASYYKTLSSQTKAERDRLVKEKEDLEAALMRGVADGSIKKNSEAWYEMRTEIINVGTEITNCDISLAEFQKSIRDFDFKMFDRFRSTLGQITDESSLLQNLLGSKDSFDENGNWTDAGKTKAGLYVQDYDTFMASARSYEKQLEDLEKKRKEGMGEEEYFEQHSELIQGYQESIQAANDAKQSMLDLAREGIQAQIDAMNELISKQKEALRQEKDNYEYHKSVTDKRKNIAKLEKQLNAISGDDSLEARKRRKQLEQQLADANEDYSDFQYDHSIETQELGLDATLEAYREQMENYSKDTGKLWADSVGMIQSNSSVIASTIQSTAQEAGYKVSQYITDAWKGGTAAVNGFASNLTDKSGGILGVIAAIGQGIKDMVKELEKVQSTTGITSDYNMPDTVQRIMGEKSEKNKKASKTGMSSLNKEIIDAGYKSLSHKDMVELANAFGILNNEGKTITLKDFDDNEISRAYKNLIAKELANLGYITHYGITGFPGGGILTGLKSIPAANGDDALITAKKGETVLTDEFTRLLPQTVEMMRAFTYRDTVAAFSPDSLPVQSSSVTFQQPLVVVEGNVTEDVMPDLKQAVNDSINQTFARINNSAYRMGRRLQN